MSYKQLVIAGKAWTHADSAGTARTGFIAKLLNALKIEVPVGYQDETGFHLGAKSSKDESKWPPVW